VQLHKTILQNKIINVLEFGVGYSTIIMADALRINEKKYKNMLIKILEKTILLKFTQLILIKNILI